MSLSPSLIKDLSDALDDVFGNEDVALTAANLHNDELNYGALIAILLSYKKFEVASRLRALKSRFGQMDQEIAHALHRKIPRRDASDKDENSHASSETPRLNVLITDSNSNVSSLSSLSNVSEQKRGGSSAMTSPFLSDFRNLFENHQPPTDNDGSDVEVTEDTLLRQSVGEESHSDGGGLGSLETVKC